MLIKITTEFEVKYIKEKLTIIEKTYLSKMYFMSQIDKYIYLEICCINYKYCIIMLRQVS